MGNLLSALALAGYALLFSFSYLHIDAGIGALLLFGSVQVTMIGWGIVGEGTRPSALEWLGTGMAILGLAALTLPGKDSPDPLGAALMGLAGVCWGIYSLRGRRAKFPLRDTAANFVMAVPFAIAAYVAAGVSEAYVTGKGVALAALSGIVTSAFGYSIWYSVLPALGATRAAVLQLSVPVLAIGAAAVLLDETPSLRMFGSGSLTLAGIALAIRGQRAK